jgi:hypothetical protein
MPGATMRRCAEPPGWPTSAEAERLKAESSSARLTPAPSAAISSCDTARDAISGLLLMSAPARA